VEHISCSRVFSAAPKKKNAQGATETPSRLLGTRGGGSPRGAACMRDARRVEGSVCCPRCNSEMDELLFIAPALNDQGLIAYECPRCGYVSSVLVEPSKRR
jgi:hypothetical protein